MQQTEVLGIKDIQITNAVVISATIKQQEFLIPEIMTPAL